MKKLTPINNVGLLMVLIIAAALLLTFLGFLQSCEDNAVEPESNEQFNFKIDGLKGIKKEDLISRGSKEKID